MSKDRPVSGVPLVTTSGQAQFPGDLADAGERCLSNEEFIALSINDLSDERRELLRLHLRRCDSCNELMNRFMDVMPGDAPESAAGELRGRAFRGSIFEEEAEYVRQTAGQSAEQAALDLLKIKEMKQMVDSTSGPPREIDSAATFDQEKKTSIVVPGPRLSFAQEQMRLELDGKRADAKWAMRRFQPSFGAGVVLDAGSACFQVWLAMRDGIESGAFDHIKVKTANFGVLSDCMKATHVLRNTSVDLLGDTFDPQHEAFYVTSPDLGMFSAFRPSEVYIGVSGVEFVGSRILIGYHGFLEKPHKQLLFRCPCRRRIILTTATKIGNAGGSVIDILSLDKTDDKSPMYKAPIYLVTTLPGPGDKTLQAQLKQAQDNLLSSEMEEALLRRGLEIHWVAVDPNGVELEDLVAPVRVGDVGTGDAPAGGARRRVQGNKR